MPESEAAGGHQGLAEVRRAVIYGKLETVAACRGGMGERLKPAVLKTVVLERVPGVRIPLPPPSFIRVQTTPNPDSSCL